MKRFLVLGAILSVVAAQDAAAACSPPGAKQVKGGALSTLLSGKTLCASRGAEGWQEEHHANGELWDYKMGDGNRVDPRRRVGTWSVTGTGANTVVTYDHGAGQQYSYEVWDNGGGSYSLCGPGGVDFTLRAGVNVGCR